MAKGRGTAEAARHHISETLRMRILGWSYDEIAAALGLQSGYVRVICKDALDAYAKENTEQAKEAVHTALQRFDTAIKSLMPQVESGHLGAIRELVRVEEARCKLLGCYAQEGALTSTADGLDIVRVVRREPN